jgi:hypothetical protein
MKLYIVSVSCMPIEGAYVTRGAAEAVATEMSRAQGIAAQVFEVNLEAEVALDFGGGGVASYPLTGEGVHALAVAMIHDGYAHTCAPPIGARIVDGGARG